MSNYTPRLNSSGMYNNPMWYSDNPFYNSGWGLPNCTCYAWGRFWEVAGTSNLPNGPTTLCPYDAEHWYAWADGYPRGSTPQLGAIACYADGDFSGLGHVCIVERDNGDGTWLVSESALNGYYFRATHSIAANGDYGYGNYVFQGFIYNPYAGSVPSGGRFRWWMARKILYKRKGVIIP